MASITDLLIAASAGATDVIKQQAFEQLSSYENDHFDEFIIELGTELADASKPEQSRGAAGLLVKNLIVGMGQDSERAQFLFERWLTLPADNRNALKNSAFTAFSADKTHIRRSSAQIFAAIAQVELPAGQSLDLVPTLVNAVVEGDNDGVRDAALSALGYICQQVECETLSLQAGDILRAVTSCMRREEQNQSLRLTATTAMNNSLKFLVSVFENSDARKQIMDSYFSSIESSEEEVRQAAYQGLIEVIDRFYEYMGEFVEDLYKYSFQSIAEDDDDVAKTAIVMWSTIAEVETKIAQWIDDGEEDPSKLLKITHQLLGDLVNMITSMMTRQDEDQDPDSWNASAAAAACLITVASCVGDDIVGYVMPFVQENVSSEDWHMQEAAILAFGSIMDGPEGAISDLVREASTALLTQFENPMLLIRESTAWTIGRMCDFHIDEILSDADRLNAVITAVGTSLQDHPRVSVHCCWAIHNIAVGMEEEAEEKTNLVSPYMEDLFSALHAVIQRPDAHEYNLMHAAYETLGALISCAAEDVLPLVEKLVEIFIGKLRESFEINTASPDDLSNLHKYQSLLLGGLHHATVRLGIKIANYANEMMDLYLEILKIQDSNLFDDALMCVGHLCEALGPSFSNYVASFMPFLKVGLGALDVREVVTNSVAVVSDLARALQSSLVPYLDDLVGTLAQMIRNPDLDQTTKGNILSAVGDIAMAVEEHFAPYVEGFLGLLAEAQNVEADGSDLDEVDVVNFLRKNILEAYTGVLQGLKEKHSENLLPFSQQILDLIRKISKDPNRDDDVVKAAVSVCGDLVNVFGGSAQEIATYKFVTDLINEALSSKDSSVKKAGKWTAQIIQGISS